ISSCVKSDKITLVDSTGRINHVLIVMNNEDWEGRVGDSLRQIIGQPLPGLPQEEYPFTVNQVDPITFNSLFKRNRNILFIGVDTLEHFYSNTNLYASPQLTLTVLGRNKDELIKNLMSHREELISTFKENDMRLYQSRVTRDAYKTNEINTFNNLGLQFKIPKAYRVVEDTGEFMWYRSTITRGLLNLIAYEVPVENLDSVSEDDLIRYRDSIGKNLIPGQFDSTYLATEKLVRPIVKSVNVGGREALESRGLWYVENDFMGGPYISYTFKDEDTGRLLVIEGFSYTPSAKKRDFLFEMESILKTVSFD
ncbi:MAG: DUF4837 family protein, partial [Lutimonas sp.]